MPVSEYLPETRNLDRGFVYSTCIRTEKWPRLPKMLTNCQNFNFFREIDAAEKDGLDSMILDQKYKCQCCLASVIYYHRH